MECDEKEKSITAWLKKKKNEIKSNYLQPGVSSVSLKKWKSGSLLIGNLEISFNESVEPLFWWFNIPSLCSELGIETGVEVFWKEKAKKNVRN